MGDASDARLVEMLPLADHAAAEGVSIRRINQRIRQGLDRLRELWAEGRKDEGGGLF